MSPCGDSFLPQTFPVPGYVANMSHGGLLLGCEETDLSAVTRQGGLPARPFPLELQRPESLGKVMGVSPQEPLLCLDPLTFCTLCLCIWPKASHGQCQLDQDASCRVWPRLYRTLEGPHSVRCCSSFSFPPHSLSSCSPPPLAADWVQPEG